MKTPLLPATSVLLSLAAASPAAVAQDAYPRAGWQANLQTFTHNVSGRVTIVDQDTLQVDDFTYDGGGLAVYFYLGADNTRAAFAAGVPASGNLLGTPRFDDSLTLHLPAGQTLDGYNAIAVWCVPAQANFGSGSFASTPEPGAPLAAAGAGVLLARRPGRRRRRETTITPPAS